MIIDVNAFLGTWLYRRIEHSSADGLEFLMKRSGVTHALVSPLESLFYRDNWSANSSLRGIAESDSLIPIPAVNPLLPDARHYLRELGGLRRIRGFKLHPDYHGYQLSDCSAMPVFESAEDLGVPIIVPIRVQDERLHHRLAMVPPTTVAELLEAAKLRPRVKIVACNARSNEILEILENRRTLANLYAAVSWAQPEGFMSSTVGRHGCHGLMWGSNMPLQNPEPTLEQVKRAEIGREEKEKILCTNAKNILRI